MELSNFTKAQELREELFKTEKLLNSTMSQEAAWIEFSYGNGSSKSVVCVDSDTIEEIRTLLRHKHELKVKRLSEEFSKL